MEEAWVWESHVATLLGCRPSRTAELTPSWTQGLFSGFTKDYFFMLNVNDSLSSSPSVNLSVGVWPPQPDRCYLVSRELMGTSY